MARPFPIAARQIGLLLVYAGGLAASLLLAFQLRFDFSVPPEFIPHLPWMMAAGLLLKLGLLYAFGQFGSLLSYFGFHDLVKIFAVCFTAAVVALAVRLTLGIPYAPPRAVILTDLLISFLFLCAFRLTLRLIREGYFGQRAPGSSKRIVIVGAGDVGASLARDLLVRRGLGMTPLAFFDDDRRTWNTTIHGVPVIGAPDLLKDYLARNPVDEAIIAIPGAPGRRVREIVAMLNAVRLRFEIVPSYEEMLTGKVRVSQLRSVEIQDLLGREPVQIQTDRIRDLIRGRTVVVTGAGGTIGGELCRQIASYAPRELLLIERSEFLLFQIDQELRELGFGAEIVPLVANVLDVERMEGIFRRYSPQLVFHAAAHKHVPLMETQPAEAFRNNTLGTRVIAELSVRHGVDRFLLISTDKAINPTNAMGATKRMAELFIQALQRQPGSRATKFMAVRFGNVLGSSGSVIPTFKRQIAAGGPVTVTHPEITRFFMTVNEAVGLVLQSAAQAEGGEIFVLDMGKPIKIADLARQLVELSGLKPETDIEIVYTGLRPGEKLYEEINHVSESLTRTTHPKILRFVGPPAEFEPLQRKLDDLHRTCATLDAEQTKLAFTAIVPEYVPYLGPR